MPGLKQQEDIRKGIRSEVWGGRCVPPLQSGHHAESSGPCRRCFSSLPCPSPTCLGAGQPAWVPMPRKPRASVALGWLPSCCLRALCVRSSVDDAELKQMVPLRPGSPNLKGSACSRQCSLWVKGCS